MNRQGFLVVVSGFSGTGKGTVMKRLIEDYEECYSLSISATTRAPRCKEEHGKDYFFVTKDEFEDMIAKDELIEYAQYVGNYYGSPKSYVESQLAMGKDVILEIEIQGGHKVKEANPNTLLLFMTPPHADDLIARLSGRGTEEECVITSRLARAIEESAGAEDYDYIVVNDDLEDCVKTVHNIIQTEHSRMARNHERMTSIKEELKLCYIHRTQT